MKTELKIFFILWNSNTIIKSQNTYNKIFGKQCSPSILVQGDLYKTGSIICKLYKINVLYSIQVNSVQ